MKQLTDREIIECTKICGTATCSTIDGHLCPYGAESLLDCEERLDEDYNSTLERLLLLSEAEREKRLIVLAPGLTPEAYEALQKNIAESLRPIYQRTEAAEAAREEG